MHLGSVYALELFLMMKRVREKSWSVDELVRELRSSGTAVTDALNRLVGVGFVVENPPGNYAFAPKSPELERLAAKIEMIYTNKPISVIKAIVAAPTEKLRLFSDAFKLKE
jgi:predicted transcriptional regulator